MEFYQCVAAAEAILFAAGEPVTIDRIALALDQSAADAEDVLTAAAGMYLKTAAELIRV